MSLHPVDCMTTLILMSWCESWWSLWCLPQMSGCQEELVPAFVPGLLASKALQGHHCISLRPIYFNLSLSYVRSCLMVLGSSVVGGCPVSSDMRPWCCSWDSGISEGESALMSWLSEFWTFGSSPLFRWESKLGEHTRPRIRTIQTGIKHASSRQFKYSHVHLCVVRAILCPSKPPSVPFLANNERKCEE